MRLDHVVPFMTKFLQAKIFAKGSYFVLGQKSRQSRELPSRKLWVELVSCYAHAYAPALTIARICQFSQYKKIRRKKLANGIHWRIWQKFSPSENFSIIFYSIYLRIQVVCRSQWHH